MKSAFITGCGGQDGSYLTELLLDRGRKVYGLVRPGGSDRLRNLNEVVGHKNFTLINGDILDRSLLHEVAVNKYDEVYHLAAQTHVGQSFKTTGLTMETNTEATRILLEELTLHSPKTRMYFAATSEMFGDMKKGECANEDFQLSAHSPYAVSKVAAHLLCRVYRQLGMFVVSGISFNHESPRRGENFVTQKIVKGVAAFKRGAEPVQLGNINAYRDWHHAQDTAHGMILSMEHDEPGEYVFSSGRARQVGEFLRTVCEYFDVPMGQAAAVSEMEKRPWDVDYLCGNSGKAKQVLGWSRSYDFESLVTNMCVAENERWWG